MKLAFLGLGVMGGPMAGHLHTQGQALTVWNRTPARLDDWAARFGGKTAHALPEAVTGADVVFLCVSRDEDVCALTDIALPLMADDGVIVDHSTISADTSRQLHTRARAIGRHFIDAPVSGGQQGAELGRLTVMCGGDDPAFQRVAPLIGAYAREVRWMGPAGAGQLTKMVNQILIAGLIQGLSEGVNFALNAGLDPEQVFAVLAKGAGQSWQMEHRHRTMADGQFDHGFAVDLMRKDLAICFAEARRNGSPLPVTALVDQYYAQVQNSGGGRWDTSSLITLLRRFSDTA